MTRLPRAIIAALLAAATQGPIAASAVDPLVVVRDFCRTDGTGGRLSPVEWTAIAPLVTWRFEPAWDRLLLVQGYQISTPRWVGDRVHVDLHYTVTAEVVPGAVRRKLRVESLTLVLIPTPDEGWLVAGPPHPPHVFESSVDPDALAQLLLPETTYESNSAFVWRLLTDSGWEIPYASVAAIPTSPHFEEIGTAAPGDLVVYFSNGAPYHVARMEAPDSVRSRTLNAGRRITPFASFAGPIRYWRPLAPEGAEVEDDIGGRESDVGDHIPAPAPLRRP